MEMLPPSGWGDVATRQQVDAVRNEMRSELHVAVAEVRADFEGLRADTHSEVGQLRADFEGFRADFAGLRADFAGLRAGFQELRADLAEGQRRLMQWTIAMVIAMASLSTAIAALVR
jgi:hypothetical protein